LTKQPVYEDIIETSTLAEHLNDPAWVIFDCRFDLMNPSWGEAEYKKAHIPTATYAHLDHDLAGPITAATGRHPLPDPVVFAQRLSGWGVENGKQVIVYDNAGGGFAARLWWMLKYYGHSAVAVLNGGYAKYTVEGRPLETQITSRPAGHFLPRINPTMLVDAVQVNLLRQDPAYKLIDARAEARFQGIEEPIDPVAGHIPGAINRFHGQNLTPDGTLLHLDELRWQFSSLIGDTPPDHVVVYCGSGVTSCHHLLAMHSIGLGMPRLYAGSWSEWIRDPNHPIDPPTR
jgi:thiosulfate/3-mercaptopyruvate sulfurtransferase